VHFFNFYFWEIDILKIFDLLQEYNKVRTTMLITRMNLKYYLTRIW